jgi:Uma2 family endonuclease
MSATLDLEAPPCDTTVDPYDHDNFEIVDGEKVELPPMSADSQVLASRLCRHLGNFGVQHNLGEAYTETLFKLPLEEDRNRKPDVAFVPYSRWPKNRMPPSTNAWNVLPDLCVEVVSPSDHVDYIMEKIDEYFRAGVRLVWIFNPRRRLAFVYESPTSVRGLTQADTLDGGVALPGFTLPLAELFPSES